MYSERRKFFITALMAICFILWQAAALWLFASEKLGESARAYAQKAQWEKALRTYKRAVRINRLNADSISGWAEFAVRLRWIREDETAALLTLAESLYSRALTLNSANADYAMRLGRVQLEQYVKDAGHPPAKRTQGLYNLMQALRLDPNGIATAYSFGHSMLSVWEHVTPIEQRKALERLVYAHTYRPEYAWKSWQRLWQKTENFDLLRKVTPPYLQQQRLLYAFIQQNGLWRYRRQQAERIAFYRQKEDAAGFNSEQQRQQRLIEEVRQIAEKSADVADSIVSGNWYGTTGGGNSFSNGNMYWSGTMHAPLNVPAPSNILMVRARGTAAKGIYPYMIVSLDGMIVGETVVDSRDWNEYTFSVSIPVGIHVVSITYDNDVSFGNVDRNLYIETATVSVK